VQPIIRLENVHHTYKPDSNHPVKALNGIDLTVHSGEYLVILGHNGSGKSTLAKHLNALLLPTEGDVWVKEWNSKIAGNFRAIRSTVGMVFQTPDNQIVSTIVEEDVAFGPENLGVPRDEIVRRVDWSLEQVDMIPFRHRAPHLLSGGQKQRVCIAGMLAMQPDVLVLDEATAMLDPLGRKEVLEVAQRLNKQEGVTIIAITHFMSEAVHADRLIVMDEGRIAMEGTPHEIFAQVEQLEALQLGVPQITQVAQALHRRMPAFPPDILTVGEFVDAFAAHVGPARPSSSPANGDGSATAETSDPGAQTTVIELRDVGYNYMHDTPLEVKAIEDVNMAIYEGEVVGVIGHTGSGKSTIIQHFNALLRPHEGVVTVFGQDTTASTTDVREVRRRVGLVFQQPEAQLFERYVGDDVAFGPRNLNLSKEEVRERVRRAMERVGLGFEEYKDRMTFSLSGGQMRRVALAGVLALEPEVLVLDEPTSGLDPQGRRQLMGQILDLHAQGTTLTIISHNMEELAEMCDRLYVIADGATYMHGSVDEVFAHRDELRKMGLDAPGVTNALDALADAGLIDREQTAVYTVAGAIELLGGLVDAKL
jgi:energy-coupling factor transport system ATP-binding protein